MENAIKNLGRNFILGGFGQTGQKIARIFTEEGIPFVDNDKSQEKWQTTG